MDTMEIDWFNANTLTPAENRDIVIQNAGKEPIFGFYSNGSFFDTEGGYIEVDERTVWTFKPIYYTDV